MNRIALIFDNSLRPETTGVYCRRALGAFVREGRLAEIEHFLPTELERIPAGKFDLFLFIDDGLEYEIPQRCHPCAWWAIDTHVSFDRCLAKAHCADWTFAAQRDGAELLQREGINGARWLPLACDPEMHSIPPVDKTFDVGFVGNVANGARRDLLALIRQHFPNSYVGQKYFAEMARTYAESRVVFNRSIANDVNMRVFEGLCSGSLLVTNELSENGQNELIQDDVHCVTYRDAAELVEKIRFYLRKDALRERIGHAGRSEVLSRHTYARRMETILSVVQQKSEKVHSVQQVRRPTMAGKDSSYFDCERPDVLALVPRSARRVLDVGCGRGRLGAALKVRQPVHVVGIETEAEAAAAAKTRLDEIHVGNIETDSLPFAASSFDCIICADVLEHLRAPDEVLKQLHGWLAPEGCLITSIPNVRNHAVVESLLAGNWTYETAGILDSDHVRFFTRREIEKLFDRCGFDVEEMQMVTSEGFDQWVTAGRRPEVKVGNLHLQLSSSEEASEFFAYQYLSRSKPRPSPSCGLTSIILVVHNQLNYTKACLDSIRFRTEEPYELIVVDNGSSDGTAQYLESATDVTVIQNHENRGFPAAANQGLRVARGDNLLLLNNDTIVTTGWLRRMLEALHSGPEIGLVGPVTNRISGEQQVEATYSQLNELDGFAWDWGRGHLHEVLETDRLVGFCLLFRRAVLERVGELDERFGIGNFEDDDFCRRANHAGFRAVIARASFVHHFGSATFRGTGIDLQKLLQQNREIYQQKWAGSNGRTEAGSRISSPPSISNPILGKPRPKYCVDLAEEGGLLLRPNTIRLSACLIVRDNERTIRPCLESIRPWVDEVVVVDTGSVDATPEICRELGARVFHWAWQDSFSAARNVSFDHARGEWLFWMDSDDTIPAACGQKLRALVDGPHEEHLLGYVMQVHCPGEDPNDVTAVDHVKLIRHRPDLRFEFRIHEQILPAIRRAGGEVGWTGIFVVHSGADHSSATRRRKFERDFRLLEMDIRERPDHPFVLFNLGMTHLDARQFDEAIHCLSHCIELSSTSDSHLRKAYALLVAALSQSDQNSQAWARCQEALTRFPDDPELLFRSAMLHHHFGRWSEAEQVYQGLLQNHGERRFQSVDLGIAGFKARHNLAVLYEDTDRLNCAIGEWEGILDERPGYRPAGRRLGELLLKANRIEEAQTLVARLCAVDTTAPEAQRLRALVAEVRGRPEDAVAILEEGLAIHGEDLELLNELCRIHCEQDQLPDAESALKRLVALTPDDPAARHNLGTVLDRQGDLRAAIEQYELSLRLRPDSDATRRQWQQALHSMKEEESLNHSV